MLKATNISVKVGKKTILDSCFLRVKPGKFTAIVGPNGAGKTTLMRAISGEQSNYNGTITLNDLSLRKYKTRDLSKIRAILPQHTVVNFPFKIEQVIEIGRYAHQTSEAENSQIVDQAIRDIGLDQLRGRTYQTLSGGEQQRVQMARVLAQIWESTPESKYLLLDEPTASLDLAQQHALLSLARKQCDRNVGVMAVLHDLNLALMYADEVLFLKKGQTVAYGSVDEVVTQQVIEDTFDQPVRILEDGGQLIIVPDMIQARSGKITKERDPIRITA